LCWTRAGDANCFRHAGRRDIEWIEAADYYVCVHAAEKSHLLRRTMAELERELDNGLFCRVHRSAIVNVLCVRSLELGDSDASVVLKSGTRLPLSRRYRKQVQARLNNPRVRGRADLQPD
jgi:two-component system LytT family response regulator